MDVATFFILPMFATTAWKADLPTPRCCYPAHTAPSLTLQRFAGIGCDGSVSSGLRRAGLAGVAAMKGSVRCGRKSGPVAAQLLSKSRARVPGAGRRRSGPAAATFGASRRRLSEKARDWVCRKRRAKVPTEKRGAVQASPHVRLLRLCRGRCEAVRRPARVDGGG